MRPNLLIVCLKFAERGYRIKEQTALPTKFALRNDKVPVKVLSEKLEDRGDVKRTVSKEVGF